MNGGTVSTTRPRAAFTLIEVLAVVVVLSMVAAVAVTRMAAATDAAQLRNLAALIKDLDARARLYARRHEALTLAMLPDESGLGVLSAETDEPVFQVHRPAFATVTLEAMPPDAALVIDRRGCSPDYRVRVYGAGSSLEWTVLGMTGSVTETGAIP